MSRVLVISGHPNLKNSLSNKTILEELQSLCPNVEIRRLDELYPDFKINIKAEQEALIKAELIILQFPFYWYGIPAILKKWIEDVFEHGFAYGSEGQALRNKKLILSLTTGAPISNYSHDGAYSHTIEEFLIPYEQACELCGIKYLAPIYSGSMMFIPNVSSDETLNLVKQKAKDQAVRLSEVIKSL